MNDEGAAECMGTILMIGVLMIIAAGVSVYTMNITGDSIPEDFTPQYAIVSAEVIPALSAHNTWNADSIKIEFTAGNELDLEYEEGVYAGTEGIKFLLYDPDGDVHEAMQSITMEGQKINPGAKFYYFTVSSAINGQYYITNQYSRIGDDSTWGGGWSYPKSFTDGKWRVVIKEDSLGTIIADEEVIIA